MHIILKTILTIPIKILFGILENLFNPLFGLGHAFTIIALLIRNEIIHFNNFNFANDLLTIEVVAPIIGIAAFLIFFGYKHKFDNDNAIVKTAGLVCLPIVGTYIFFFSYIMGLLNLWIGIISVQPDSAVDPYISYSFSAWTFIMSWFMRQQLEGVDGKGGMINGCTRYLMHRFPILAKYDENLTRRFYLFICRIRRPTFPTSH